MFVPAAPRLTLDRAGDWRSLWPNDAAIFTRARFALAEGLGALRRRHRIARVWIPAYLCAPVPEAVQAAGLEPVLYDVDARLGPRYDTIAPERGDALLVVHYFGLVTPLDRLRAFCAEHALPLIEDCAHALPSPDGRGAGSAGQMSVWSLRKLGPLPGGGVLTMRDATARHLVTVPHPRLAPDTRTLGRLAILAFERCAEIADINPLRFKDRLPVIDASAEPAGPTPRIAAHLDEYASPPRPARLIRLLFERADWGRVTVRRRSAYHALVAELPRAVVAVPDPPTASVPEAMPVFVDDPKGVVGALRRRGIEAMAWPGAEQFAFDHDRFPNAARWLERSFCLPVGTSLTRAAVRRVGRVVRETLAEFDDGPVSRPGASTRSRRQRA